MEIRKLFKAGNSLVLALPKKALEELGLAEGDHVSVELDPSRGGLAVSPLRSSEKKDDLSGVEDFLSKYGKALEQLEKP